MENFDYNAALKKLEAIAAKVEDPLTGIEDMDRYIVEADGLIAECRAFLREARERTETLG